MPLAPVSFYLITVALYIHFYTCTMCHHYAAIEIGRIIAP